MDNTGISDDVVSCIKDIDIYNSLTLKNIHGINIFDDRATNYSFKAGMDVNQYGQTYIESVTAGELNDYLIT